MDLTLLSFGIKVFGFYLSICLSVYLSVCLRVCLSASVCVCLFVCIPAWLSVYLYVFIVDHFYIALFSTLEQTHCARIYIYIYIWGGG